jgi:Ca2+-binding EF-hand superfamily protein
VRKAWLALDDDGNGSIGAEHFARFLGASGTQGFDFTLMEILVKMHSKGMGKKIIYNEFTQWLGQSIYPKEEHFFRHDSKKNP